MSVILQGNMRVVQLNQLEKYRRRERRNRSIKRILRLLVVVLFVFFGTGLYAAFALTRPVPTVSAQPVAHNPPVGTKVQLAWPAFGKAAVGATGYGLLDNNNGDQKAPSASVIKVLTALAVLDKHPLARGEQGPLINIEAADVEGYKKFLAVGGSVFPVNLGQQITEYQALQALLLPSANNIADTLARWSYGSLEGYNQAANSLAKTIGMTNTTISDASGFSPQTVSTANDLVRLGMKAMEHPVIADIVSQSEAVLPGGHNVRNVNTLLGQKGFVGIKTGSTDEAGGCFLFASSRQIQGQTVTVIGAIIGEPSRNLALADAVPLADSAHGGFEEVTAIRAGQVFNTYNLPWQGTVNAVAKEDVRGVAWKSKLPEIQSDSPPLSGPRVTSVPQASANFGQQSAATPLVLDAPVKPPGKLWRLLHPLR